MSILKPHEEPTLPLSDENGNFLPGVSAIPGRRSAVRMWQLCALTDAEHHKELLALVQTAERHGVTWAHPAARNGAGCTPLHVVAIHGKPHCCEVLLNYRGRNNDVNITDDFGNTALMAAACRGRPKVCELLLLAGANPNAHNQRGYTALGAAVDAAHADCVALLMAHGAKADPAQRPAQARSEAKKAQQPFHWDRGLAAQSWLQHPGMPGQSRRCRELDQMLSKHLLSACPDAALLETPHDRFRRAERAHEKRRQEEMVRKREAGARQAAREEKLSAWKEKIERATLRQYEARHEPSYY